MKMMNRLCLKALYGIAPERDNSVLIEIFSP